jgi:hypothetical protein
LDIDNLAELLATTGRPRVEEASVAEDADIGAAIGAKRNPQLQTAATAADLVGSNR